MNKPFALVVGAGPAGTTMAILFRVALGPRRWRELLDLGGLGRRQSRETNLSENQPGF
jgi:thioredoxin reductase